MQPRLVQQLAGLAALALLAAPASAATRWVANYGADSGICGVKTAPCRSISQAVTNAVAGDTIVVGPGLYGDLDRDGQSDAGEEETVVINKPLTVISSHGATATLFVGLDDYAIEIAADAVIFGKRNKGFTIVPDETGVHVNPGFQNVQVNSNIVLGGDYGLVSRSTLILRDNRAVETGTGFYLEPQGAPSVVEGNIVRGAYDNGFQIILNATAGALVLRKNAVSACGTGIYVEELHNEGGPLQISGNTVVGNYFSGVFVSRSGGTADLNLSISGNNVFGNGAVDANCGLAFFNISSFAANIDASNNYWGAPAPGADPADTTCGYTTFGALPPVITTSPAASAELNLAKPKPIR